MLNLEKEKIIKTSLLAAFLITSPQLLAKSYAEVYPVSMETEYDSSIDNSMDNSKIKNKLMQRKHYEDFQYGVHRNLNDTILELADKLLLSSKINNEDMGELAITSFVDLHKLNKTTHFGRTVSESMFDELFIRGFNVSEFRGQSSLSVNKRGEYFITRDVELLSNSIPNKYILVGTYSSIENRMLINARILNNTTGKIVASARAYYRSNDCRVLENCPPPRKIKIVTQEPIIEKKSTIKIKAAKYDSSKMKMKKDSQVLLSKK